MSTVVRRAALAVCVGALAAAGAAWASAVWTGDRGTRRYPAPEKFYAGSDPCLLFSYRALGLREYVVLKLDAAREAQWEETWRSGATGPIGKLRTAEPPPAWALRRAPRDLDTRQIAAGFGWPLPCLWWGETADLSTPGTVRVVAEHAVVDTGLTRRVKGWASPVRLPVGVLPVGLAADACVWGALIAAAAYAPGAALRWSRRRRGRCVGCGYDLSGSLGACPECGVSCAGRTAGH